MNKSPTILRVEAKMYRSFADTLEADAARYRAQADAMDRAATKAEAAPNAAEGEEGRHAS